MLCLGLDFGTSNSVATLWMDGELRPVDPLQRSLFFIPDETFDGNAPGTRVLLGNDAATAYFQHRVSGRLIQSIKSHLASNVDELSIAGSRVGIEALLGRFLSFLRERAAAVAGVPVERLDRVVLGRPVRFHLDPAADARAERRLLRAAALAGFDAVAFQLEPVAAALDYELVTTAEELVLVGDLGGGTSDFALVRVGPGRGLHDRGRDVLATSGVPLAGNALDREVVRRRILDHFGARATMARFHADGEPLPWHPSLLAEVVDLPRVPLLRTRGNEEYLRRVAPLIDPRIAVTRLHDLIFKGLGFSLAEAVEAAKVALSDAEATRLVYREESIDLDFPLDRPEWDTLTRPVVDRITGALDEVLAAGGVRPGDVSRVFLTGGTSQVPALRHAFDSRFGAERVFVGEVFTSVATGLARSWPLAMEDAASARVAAVREAGRAPPPVARIHVEPPPMPTAPRLSRVLANVLSQPVDRLSGGTVAYLHALLDAHPAEPLGSELDAWLGRVRWDDDEVRFALLRDLDELAPTRIPTSLRVVVEAWTARDEVSARRVGELRDRWDGVEPEAVTLLETPASATAAKAGRATGTGARTTTAVSTHTSGKGKAAAANADQAEAVTALLVATVTMSKQGLRENILLDSVRMRLPVGEAEVKAALGRLLRAGRLKRSAGRIVA